ncbi:hypothetical protein [uncultured Clostridium sp.]|uniref:hypothetical protein n=1 Tax=uncultured Clostridium sp. TaxID=59620 RepID=UPI0026F3E306|nr:hypothetical protein [uncultured Clostridium sp.]
MRVFNKIKVEAVMWNRIPHLKVIEGNETIMVITVGLMAEGKPIILCRDINYNVVTEFTFTDKLPSNYYMITEGLFTRMLLTDFTNPNIKLLGYKSILQNRESIKYILNITKVNNDEIILSLPRVKILFTMDLDKNLMLNFPLEMKNIG